mmetsp:Transcript_16611/g.14450  ORF Transcript_16611/g.14450 Transcript_16611/m.14450 type:complete len:123 (-) Transcript_16611:564-932(-)
MRAKRKSSRSMQLSENWEDSFVEEQYYDHEMKTQETLKLEKTFYTKKLIICATFSVEKNPLDFVLNDRPDKKQKKFSNEVIYLRLQDDEEEEEKDLEEKLMKIMSKSGSKKFSAGILDSKKM